MKENAFPRLVVFRDRIVENTRRVVDLCRRSGVTVTGVTKGVCAHPCVVNAMLEGGCSCLADSRIENVMLLKKCVPSASVLLLRIPMPGEIRKVVAHADCCAVSMTETILLIQRECERTNNVHSVLLMFDLGDLREGFWPDEVDSIAATLRSCPRVRVAGVGVNFGCFGGTIPSVRALEELVHIRASLEPILGVPIPMISGGGHVVAFSSRKGASAEGRQQPQDRRRNSPWTRRHANAEHSISLSDHNGAGGRNSRNTSKTFHSNRGNRIRCFRPQALIRGSRGAPAGDRGDWEAGCRCGRIEAVRSWSDRPGGVERPSRSRRR